MRQRKGRVRKDPQSVSHIGPRMLQAHEGTSTFGGETAGEDHRKTDLLASGPEAEDQSQGFCEKPCNRVNL